MTYNNVRRDAKPHSLTPTEKKISTNATEFANTCTPPKDRKCPSARRFFSEHRRVSARTSQVADSYAIKCRPTVSNT